MLLLLQGYGVAVVVVEVKGTVSIADASIYAAGVADTSIYSTTPTDTSVYTASVGDT